MIHYETELQRCGKGQKKITGQQGRGEQSPEVHYTVKQKHACAFPSLSSPFLAHITTQLL